MSAALVQILEAGDVDVSTAALQDTHGRRDSDQLALAAGLGRSLYTFNVRDFARLHAECLRQGRHHAGIIVANDQTMPIGEQGRPLLRLASVFSAEEIADRIEYLGGWG